MTPGWGQRLMLDNLLHFSTFKENDAIVFSAFFCK